MAEVRESTVWLRCTEEFVDRETGDRRFPGDEWETGVRRGKKLGRGPLAVIVTGPGGEVAVGAPGDPWPEVLGRDLRTVPDEGPAGYRVVACLNIWNDADALERTVDTWYEHVDRVIAVDGAYPGAPAAKCASTDGTLDLLGSMDKVTLVEGPDEGFWANQVVKRNAYMDMLEEGDLCFIVDADEFATGADCLRYLPRLDVGWVVYRKSLYHKDQNFPRLYDAGMRPRYDGRHYWTYGDGGFATDCQHGGAGYDHVWVPVRLDNTQGKRLRTGTRTRAKSLVQSAQFQRESRIGRTPVGGRESLRIAQIAPMDAGLVVFRLHTALNATTPHTSIMGARPHGNRPWDTPRQYDLTDDRDVIRRAVQTCDVVHCHLHYQALDRLAVSTDAPVVIHHHGTMLRSSPESRAQQDARRADVRLVSNPELLKYGEDLDYLPNPVPAVRYGRLRERLYEPDPDGWVRVGHSPSKREYKATETFLEVVESLRSRGVKIRSVLMEDMPHSECLRTKAQDCDLFFDSFWLGMQCSGLEAGAMGIPVIAGDEDVRSWHGGETPYVFANDADELEDALMRLYPGHGLSVDAASRIRKYVTEHHDYAAVTSRYLDILDERLDWRSRLSLGRDLFLNRKD